jgi:hypothetical protein
VWYDELWSTRVVLGTLGDTLRSTLVDVHPPLYSLVMFVWTRLLGDSELAIRLLPLLAGLGTIALMPALGGALATRPAGWLAAVLLALSPVHVWYSQEARAYSLLILLTVLLVLAWRRVNEESAGVAPSRWFVLLAVSVTQLHYFAIAIPAAIAAVAVLHRRHRTVALAALGFSFAGVAVVLGVKIAAGVLATESGYLGAFSPAAAQYLFLNWLPTGNSILPAVDGGWANWVVAGITLPLVVSWVALGWQRLAHQPLIEHLLVLIAVPGLLILLHFLGQENYYIQRSAIPSLPFFLLGLATGADLIAREMLRRTAFAGLLLGSVIVFGAFSARRGEWTVYKPNPDWRAILPALDAGNPTPDAPLLVFSTTPVRELEYYVDDAVVCDWPPVTSDLLPPTTFRGRLARLFERSERLTCGVGGTATIRLYARADSGISWIDDVRSAERGSRAVVILNHYWTGRTPTVLSSLRARGFPLPLVDSARGLEVFALER